MPDKETGQSHDWAITPRAVGNVESPEDSYEGEGGGTAAI